MGYFLFEVPSNLILHKIGARVWIARILITWGIVATLSGFVQSVHQLYVARFALGLAEAGYFPGIALYLGYWFRQREKAQAIAIIIMGIPIASVLGAPVSGFILDHVHWFGLSSWRWLLILEGFPAIACVPLVSFLLPNRPAEAPGSFYSGLICAGVSFLISASLSLLLPKRTMLASENASGAGVAFKTSSEAV